VPGGALAGAQGQTQTERGAARMMGYQILLGGIKVRFHNLQHDSLPMSFYYGIVS
jgi:hypothetical protein